MGYIYSKNVQENVDRQRKETTFDSRRNSKDFKSENSNKKAQLKTVKK
jgi:hypothetical protein